MRYEGACGRIYSVSEHINSVCTSCLALLMSHLCAAYVLTLRRTYFWFRTLYTHTKFSLKFRFKNLEKKLKKSLIKKYEFGSFFNLSGVAIFSKEQEKEKPTRIHYLIRCRICCRIRYRIRRRMPYFVVTTHRFVSLADVGILGKACGYV